MAGEVAAPQAANSSSARRQPRVNRMQQMAQRLTQLTRAVTLANDLVQLAHNQVSSAPQSVVAPRMLGPYSSLIRAIEALDAESSSKRRAVITDQSFAAVLIKRTYCRDTILHLEGRGTGRLLASMAANLASSDSLQKQDENNELANTLKQSEEVFQLASSNVADLRRAFALDPGRRRELSDLMSLSSTMATIAKMVSVLTATQRVQHRAEDLESMLGAPATQLVRQSAMLESVMQPFLFHSNELLSEDWAHEMRPIAADLASVCLDLAACAMDLALPEPTSTQTVEQISKAKSLLDNAVEHCLDLADLMSQWKVDHPFSGAGEVARDPNTRSACKPGSFVSVRAATGLHVPARVQADGTLLTLGLSAEVVGPSSSSSLEFSTANEVETDSETESVSESQVQRMLSRAARMLQKGEALIAPDFNREFRQVTAGKGYTDPDILTPSYRYHSEKWQGQASEMRSIADQLVNKFAHVAYETDAQMQASRELPDRLRERASILELKSQELMRPETRWSLIKGYVRPQARQWAELLANGQIDRVGGIAVLPSTPPGTVFEVRIQSRSDADGTTYPPVWLHLHSKQPMTPKQVSRAGFERFDAVHLKSDADKNRGRQWVHDQRAGGNFNADVHRSSVNAELLKEFMRLSK